jgi:3-methyladenine DNA glycosylase AlkD
MEENLSEKIISVIEKNKDPQKAEKMSAYMKNRFDFAGIQRPNLKKLTGPLLKKSSKEKLDRDLVFTLRDCDYREAQYVAIDYLNRHIKEIKVTDIGKLEKLLVEKSRWDSVDALDAFVGELVKKDPDLKNLMLTWAESENIRLRRVAINYQHKFKEETDKEMLEKIILKNLGSKEFFINKAIGRSLREYGKTNPNRVLDFVEKHRDKMATLSIKEATKNL